MTVDVQALADDYAKRIGWQNDAGFHVAHPNDIAKGLMAFHKECQDAKQTNCSEETNRTPASEQPTKPVLHCGLCGLSEHDVTCLIAGKDTNICGHCTQICADILLKKLWDNATRLQDTIKGIEKHGGIPSVAGVSDQEIPTKESDAI
ncbi:ClpX C4-type zinc finger protein [Zavarzinella formosa]|uniref:ClpX C4-type zinc finger protein n=1 Tax=Zavarzinella formosa TaxID=360055 RepID=UPI00037CD9D8|nr:ClpX C4-type zinc finger protein [Zavarzinella formosa]